MYYFKYFREKFCFPFSWLILQLKFLDLIHILNFTVHAVYLNSLIRLFWTLNSMGNFNQSINQCSFPKINATIMKGNQWKKTNRGEKGEGKLRKTHFCDPKYNGIRVYALTTSQIRSVENRSYFGRNSVQAWVKSLAEIGRLLVRTRSTRGPAAVLSWAKSVEIWSKIGPASVRPWSRRPVQTSVENWSKIGPAGR